MAPSTMPGSSERRRSLLRNAAEYSLGAGLGLVGSMLRVALTARLLTAEARGLWLALQLAYGYGQNLHLGVASGMFRSVPMLRATGADAQAEACKSTTWTFMALMSGLGWVVLVPVAFSVAGVQERRAYILTGVLTTVSLARTYYTCVFKAESRFRDLSLSSAVGSVTSIVTVGLVWVAGLDGLIGGMIIQAMVEAGWLARAEGVPKFHLDTVVLRQLLSVGIMTLLITVGTLLLSNVDRTVMLSRFGTTETGNYYVGANILVLLPVMVALPANVLTPRFFEVYGRTGNGAALRDLVERPVRAAGVLFAVCLAAIALALPAGVAHLFPNLVAGNTAARVAIVATFPLVMSGLVGNVFYAMNRLLSQLLLLVGSAAVGYLAAQVGVRLWPGIASAAAGGAIGFAVYYVAAVLAAYILMLEDWRPGVRLVIQSLLPAIAATGVVLLCEVIGDRLSPAASIVRGVASELFLFAVFAPWLIRSVRSLRPSTSPST